MSSNLLEIKLRLEGSQYNAAVNSAGAATDKFTGKAKVSLGSVKTAVVAGVFAFNQMATAVTTVAHAAEAAFRPIAQMQTDLSNIASLGADSVAANMEVRASAYEVASSMHDLRDGYYQVISASVDLNARQEVLTTSARAAVVGHTEVAEALNLQAAVVKAWGKDWRDADDVMDKAIVTVKLGQTTIPELTASIGQAAPGFAALKFETKELFGAVATLSGVTGSTSEVMTQLKAITTNMMKPKKELVALIEKETGVSYEQAVAQEGLTGILEILKEETNGSSVAMGKFFESSEAINALLPLTSSLYEKMIENTDAMTESTGALSEAYEEFEDDLDVQIQMLKNKWTMIVEDATAVAVPFANAVLSMADSMLDGRSAADKMAESLEDVNRNLSDLDEVDTLISRYETLMLNTDRTTEEQEELRKVTEKLAKLFPDAVTAVDAYGKALKINSGYVQMMVNSQRDMLRLKEKDIFADQKNALKEYIQTLSLGNTHLEELQKTQTDLANDKAPAYISATTGTLFSPTKADKATESYKDFKNTLLDAQQQLPVTISLLGNFIDLQNPEAVEAFADQLGLEAGEYEILTARIDAYLKSLEAANAAKGTPTTTPTGTTTTNTVVTREQRTVGTTIETAESAGETWDPSQDMADAYALNDALRDSDQISEQEYYNERIRLAQEWYDTVVMLGDEHSLEAQEAAAEIVLAEQDAAAATYEAWESAVGGIVGNLATLMNSAQGTNKTMFAVGKAMAVAEATYNTYTSAVAAYKSVVGIPIVGPGLAIAAAVAATAAGLANVAKINAVKFESRDAGGPYKAGGTYYSGVPEFFIPDQDGFALPASMANQPNTNQIIQQSSAPQIDYDKLAGQTANAVKDAMKDVTIVADLLDGLKRIDPQYQKYIKETTLI